MATKKQKQKRLIESVLKNVDGSPVKAHRVVLFIASWGVCMRSLGRPPANIEEYSDWWAKSRATGYREQELFREALPMYATPTPICDWLAADDPAVFDQPAAVAAFTVGARL